MSEADMLTWIGVICAWLAPLTIGTFVVVGARHRRSYDAWRHTMTDLGDGVDGVATAFLVVNTVVGALLGVFAWAVWDSLEVRTLTVALVIAAVGSVVFGLTACEDKCKRPLCEGTAPGWLPRFHLAAAGVVATGIVVAPLLTWFVLDDRPGDLGLLRAVSVVLGAAAALLLGGLLRELSVQRRNLRAGPASHARPGLLERLLWIVGYGWVVMLATSLVRPGWPAALALGAWLIVALWYVLRPDWHDPSPEFALGDCQPGTLTSVHKVNAGLFRVCSIDDPATFGRQLRTALEGERPLLRGARREATSAVTLAVTFQGLLRLGVPYRWRAGRQVEDAFRHGMKCRARALGDVGPSDPDNWDDGWRDPKRLHVAFWIQAENRTDLEELDDRVTEHFASVTTQVEESTARLGHAGRSLEHFGFVDGASQPWVDGVPRPDGRDVRGGGKLRTSTPSRELTGRQRNLWRPLALGEFVVGQADETGGIFPVPSPHEVFLGGTFLVVRKLRQDVDAFRRYVGEDGPECEREELAPRLVGRTKDGAPLVAPLRGRWEATDKSSNVFTYGDDPEGLLCPLGAHIRRANPRDALGFGSTLTSRRRIIRRGMPYGPSWQNGEPTDDRGLLFAACNVRIVEQFEFVQQHWLNDGSPFGVGNAPDPIGGGWDPASPRAIVVGGRPPQVAPTHAFVSTAGGEYFFVPSITGLRALADLTSAPRRPE